MGISKEPEAVKLFVALFCNSEELFPTVEWDLTSLFGAVDSASEILPWKMTKYYEREMGPELFRRFLSFGPLIFPGELPRIKLLGHGVEVKFGWCEGGRKGRRVNIDPSYLEAGKVVLASTKNAPHCVYLLSGVYGEMTLAYQNGSFEPLASTYLDYRWPETLSFFSSIRSRYLAQL